MLFHRDFREYTGGHGKVWDYFKHALALGWDARVYLTPGSTRSPDNPWMTVPDCIETRWSPGTADILFLAGMDWHALPADVPHPPVVNLIQGLRHAVDDPALPLRTFLARPAWRICVSQAVADAVAATGEANGPLHTIPAGLGLTPLERPPAAMADVFIAAAKQPLLGAQIAGILEGAGYSVRLADRLVGRTTFLDAMAGATVTVLLPYESEGFFLPGLEAMALGTAVVMSRCGGSAAYADHGINCILAPRDPQALAAAAVDLLVDPTARAQLVEAGKATVERHGLEAERAAFRDVLSSVLRT